MALLRVDGLQVSFGERIALDGTSFFVEAGEVYGLVGPNGAGKTTTINVICDMLRPQSGEVWLDGARHVDAPRKALGLVPQELSVYRDLTAIQNLEFFGRIYGLDRSNCRTRADACLASVGLSDRARSRTSALSGGMQRRLHVACALMHEPPLLILDEPTVGLDLASRQQMWNLISDLQAAGTAILLTTHHLEEAERLCSRIGVLRAGRIVAEGTLEELRQLIPAKSIAAVSAAHLELVSDRAHELEITVRPGHGELDLWLTGESDVRAVAEMFDPISLRSIRIRPVGLEDILAEFDRA